MMNWLKKLFKKNGKNNSTCQDCVWWQSEEALGMKPKKGKHYCWQQKQYTKANDSCRVFEKEKFEADEFSTATPEYSLDFEVSAEKTGEDDAK